jgi:hypothetical protein
MEAREREGIGDSRGRRKRRKKRIGSLVAKKNEEDSRQG